jgi:hypothetical protein
MGITLALGNQVWREFKAECTRRGLVASRVVEAFMSEQLKKWGVELEEEQPKRPKKK